MKSPFEAIALEYGQRKTPRVVAKGQAELAQRIIEEAKRQGIYVAEDPQLLALLSKLDVGEEITQDMYTAVAVILSWVYWLKGMQPGDEQMSPAGKTAAASNVGKAP
ncbi:MAG: Flagellar biosynthetic protein FlhB [Pseudomonadota bacterium]|jgi:flagellar biosynthesis protein